MTAGSTRVLIDLLAARTGQSLPESRMWRLNTALAALFREHGLAGVDALVARLARPGETALASQVVEALLNNETYFFRDRAMFDLIAQSILPQLAERRAADRRIAIWSAGCSTGQEALSLAMLFAGQEARWAGWTIDILGTDVSEAVIEGARRGRYSQFEIQRGLGVTEMIRWFDEADDGWQAKPKLLGAVRYEARNLFDPPPARARFDIVLCRNVLLYFDGATRSRAFDRLAGALAPDGWLMLGAGETVIGQTDRLVPSSDPPGFHRIAAPDSVSRFSRAQRAAG